MAVPSALLSSVSMSPWFVGVGVRSAADDERAGHALETCSAVEPWRCV